MLDDVGGVWRTVGGRRIFIKDGEDLETAMKNSGKFNKKSNELTDKEVSGIYEEYKNIIQEYSDKADPYFLSDKKSDQKKFDEIMHERDNKINQFIKDKFNVSNDEDMKKYKDMFQRVKAEGMPVEASYEITKWEIVNSSPYSSSYYNANNISWGSKPEGSLRISDHWNFKTRGGDEIHCKLKGIKDYQSNRWILAKYENGEYIIIKEFKNEK